MLVTCHNNGTLDADQLGEHGIWCKQDNFELATHTVLMISWPAKLGGRPGRSNSYVECASTPSFGSICVSTSMCILN